jgi:hypothetical protein
MAESARRRARALRRTAALAYTSVNRSIVEHTSGNMPAMTRTPIITVTANAFAARAFAWGLFRDAHPSAVRSETLPPLH